MTAGSSVALAIAEDIIAIHLGKDEAGAKPLPAHMAQAIRGALFYVVARISPDGAEGAERADVFHTASHGFVASGP